VSANVRWESVMEAPAEKGWSARVVDAGRLSDLRARVAAVLDSGDLPEETAARLADDVAFALPDGLEAARSVIVGAVARPLTQATLIVGDAEHTVSVPPHYASYFTIPDGLAEAAGAAFAPFGHRAVRFEPPLKTLAVCASLARYGRNNIAYVPGLGSYLMLAACATDAPSPDDATWAEPPQLALRALQRLPACLPHRRHPRRPLPARNGSLPDLRERRPRPVPRVGGPGLAHLRRRLSALSAGMPRERACGARDRAAGGVRRAGIRGDPRRHRPLRARPSDTRQARELRPRLLSRSHRQEPLRAARRLSPGPAATVSRPPPPGTITIRGKEP